MKTHLIIPDPHARPDHNNDRADWIGNLIADLKPDVVVNMGDTACLPSLSRHEEGASLLRSYEEDIESHLNFQERLWAPIRKLKKKTPYRVILEGNHENRMKTFLAKERRLQGRQYGIGFRDLEFDRYYHDSVEYEGSTPGVIEIDGINYAHYFVSGVMARPIGGERIASALLNKHFSSCTMGHTHTLDYAVRTSATGERIQGLVCGWGGDYRPDWAGQNHKLWWGGVIIKRGVENGQYDPEFISMERLKRIYGDD